MNHITKKIITASVLLGLASLASAQVLMLNFRSSSIPSGGNLTNSPYNTENPGFSDTTWNNVSNSDVASGLLWADGTSATGIGFDLGVANRALNGAAGTTVDLTTSVTTANDLGSNTNIDVYLGNSVGTGGIYSGTTSSRLQVGLQVTGLDAGIYEVYVTGRNTNAGTGSDLPYTYYASSGVAGANFDYSGYDSASLSFIGVNSSSSAWVETGNTGANYAKFTISLSAGEALNIVSDGDGGTTSSGAANRGFLNSVQIVAVPEPQTITVMLGGLAFGFVLIRRKLC